MPPTTIVDGTRGLPAKPAAKADRRGEGETVGQLMDRMRAVQKQLRYRSSDDGLRRGMSREDTNYWAYTDAYTRRALEVARQKNQVAFDGDADDRGERMRAMQRIRSQQLLSAARKKKREFGASVRRAAALEMAAAEAEARAPRTERPEARRSGRRDRGRARFLRTCRSTGLLSVRHSNERNDEPEMPSLRMPLAGVPRDADAGEGARGGAREISTQTEGPPTPRLELAANLHPMAHVDERPYWRGRKVGDWSGAPGNAWMWVSVPNLQRPVREYNVGARLSPRTRTQHLWDRLNPAFEPARVRTGPSTRMTDYDGKEEGLLRESAIAFKNRGLRKITNTNIG